MCSTRQIFKHQANLCYSGKVKSGELKTGLLIFRAVAEPRISSKSAKFARNLTKLIHVSTTSLKVILAVGAAYLL